MTEPAVHAAHTAPDRDPFFVVGTGRCGSTLLQAMLISHPDIRMPPETQYFEHLDPAHFGFTDPVADDDADDYLARALSERARFFLDATPGTADAYAAAVRAGLRRADEQFLWICDRLTGEQTGTRLGEKTPQHWKFIDRIGRLFPNARFVHLVRDPRDVVAGLIEMDWWENKSIRRTAKYCRKALETALAYAGTGPDRHTIVRYEDLIDAPETVLRSVCASVGVAFHDGMLDHRANARHTHRADEESYKGQTGQPIVRARIGRYRSRLSGLEIRLIESTVGPDRMASLGYDPDPDVARPAWSAIEPVIVRAAESVGLAPAKRNPQHRATP